MATDKERASYHVPAETRQTVIRLAADLGIPQGDVLTSAVRTYEAALSSGTVEPPGRSDTLSQADAERLTVYITPGVREWVAEHSQSWNVQLGAIVTMAVRHYEATAPAPGPRPEPKTEETQRKPASRAGKPPQPPKARTGTPPPARGHCPACRAWLSCDIVDGAVVMRSHIVFARDESHPRGGEHRTCDGSGKPCAGRAVREPRVDRSKPN